MRILPRALAAFFLVLSGACSSLPVVGRSAPERWAFHAPWDPRSDASVRAHGVALDGVVLDWIALDSITGLPLRLYRDSLSPTLPSHVRRMAIVTTWLNDRFNPELIRRLGTDSLYRSVVAASVADRMVLGGYHGAVLDFEGMTGADTSLTRAVVATFANVMRMRGVGPVAIALPAGDTVGYPARLFPGADLLMIMLYDQHWSTSPPGAIAEPAWVRRTLAMRVAESGASRMVAALPTYGYLWRPNLAARAISLDEARRLVAEAGVSLDRDPATATLHAVRSVGDQWELWISDVVLLSALQREVAALNVTRVAYWRLGTEDVAMWQ